MLFFAQGNLTGIAYAELSTSSYANGVAIWKGEKL